MVLVLALSSTVTAEEGRRFMLVLDESNSMWGQIEGVCKIEIARDVIGKMVKDWPEGRPLGVLAYGHRRKGDCHDIELVLPVGPVDSAKIISTVNRLRPKGKTPLTEP